MFKIILIYFVLFALGVDLAFAQKSPSYRFINEKEISFGLNRKITDQNGIQFFFNTYEPADILKIQQLEGLDYLDQVKTAETETDPDYKIKKILVIKTAFNLKKSIQDIRNMNLDRIENLQAGLEFKYNKSCQNKCDITQDIKYLIFTIEVKTNLEVQAAQNSEIKAFAGDHIAELPGYELRILGRKWSNIFTLTQSVSYFTARDNNTTDVVNYQIISIKNISYSKIHKLEDIIKKINQKELQKLIQFLNKPNNTSNRNPAASSYDKDLYQQLQYSLYDSEGDRALIERTNKAQKNIINFFAKPDADISKSSLGEWAPDESDTLETADDKAFSRLDNPNKMNIQGREKPINVKRFTESLIQVMKEENMNSSITPKLGEFHEWSPETFEKYRGQSMIIGFNKVFVALCMGFTSRFMKTDQEENLKDWILTQPFNSIELVEMFRQSYRLNKGDVYLSLMTIENILASNWRYKGRENLPVTKRLKPFVSGYNYDSDRYGTWYHFFGMVIFGYMKGGFTADFVGRVEALGSNIMSKFKVDKTQKQWLNRLGGYVGDGLREAVVSHLWNDVVLDAKKIHSDYYLNTDEDFRDRLSYTLSDSIKAEAWGYMKKLESIHLKSLKSDLQSCQIDIILDTGSGLHTRNMMTFKNKNLSTTESLILRVTTSTFESARIFVHKCANEPSEFVMETRL